MADYGNNTPSKGDNCFRFDITGERNIEGVIALAFSEHKKAHGWLEKDGVLYFYWYANDPGVQAFPVSIGHEAATAMIKDWLEVQNYGTAPDTDGSTGRGWRVYNEHWGHVNESFYGFVAVAPHWIIYGK